jgi:hypothetical protein
MVVIEKMDNLVRLVQMVNLENLEKMERMDLGSSLFILQCLHQLKSIHLKVTI